MPTIRLPDTLAGAPHATVTRWRVSSGQSIAQDQILAELETYDAVVHVRSSAAGTLGRIIAGAGMTVKVGAELADLTTSDAAPTPPPITTSGHAPVKTAGPTATPILMPQAGNTMEEGRIVQWRVQAGSVIKVGQVLCEIETDKSTIEFESPVTGTIGAIVVANGESIAVKQPIAYLDDGAVPAAEKKSAPAPISSTLATQHAPAPTPAPTSTHAAAPTITTSNNAVTSSVVVASPAARRLAQAQGVDLASIGQGSGPGGRILSTDLARAARSTTTADAVSAPLAPITGPIAEPLKRPLSKMRRAIAVNLQQSKQTVPHFYLSVTINAGPLLGYAKKRKADAGCSVNDVVIAALGRAIHEFPAMRSRFDGDSIVEWGSANIGIAVGLDDGLVVPVVMQVERLTLAQLATETKRVIDNARKGKLENLGKAVFSISNLGMFGVEQFQAIINPPESGILAVGAAREAVLVADGAMRPGRLMTLTLSADHRVVDGLVAAKCMARLKELLEAPEQLV